MKRVGGLRLQAGAGRVSPSPDGRTPDEQLAEIRATVRPMVARQREILTGSILPELARRGIELVTWAGLSEPERAWCRRFFTQSVFV